ncbi:MAG TPA: SDR family oxidoreductase [Rhizobiaceae bacterium]|nr:SDR family oxidoreductase [Rhizobiaceae bacterium]
MTPRLKPLNRQIIVITGATSGIGLVTARNAARAGARLVLAARSEEALFRLEQELSHGGRHATAVVADVGKPEDVQRIVRLAKERFGGFDTWVNNAGVTMYGKLMDEPIEDMRRLFETNFWGLVYGSLEAARYFMDRRQAGAIINVGSTLSERALILQGMYSASKHAVKGFTDALRMELEKDGHPIAVTLVQPGAIDTPYRFHAKNYMDRLPTSPPPVYAPETVARTILHCAETPQRHVYVGASGKGIPMAGWYAPRLTDLVMEALFVNRQKTDRPARPREQNGLDRPAGRLEERGGYEGHVSETSLYTTASLHPFATGALVAAGAFALVSLVTRGAVGPNPFRRSQVNGQGQPRASASRQTTPESG